MKRSVKKEYKRDEGIGLWGEMKKNKQKRFNHKQIRRACDRDIGKNI